MSNYNTILNNSLGNTKWSPEPVKNLNQILDMERYNGRMNLMDTPDKNIRFQMYEKIHTKNKSTGYRNAVEGILEDNLLSNVYFSSGNVQILQNGLRAGVYEMSGNKKIIIPPQNIDHLKIIMRSMYLQYAEHREDISITKQVEELNRLVLDYVIPTVYNETMGYLKYLEDQSTLVQPLEMPKLVDRDYKTLELKQWF